MAGKRIAVIGAGPIGLEAALYASRLGHDVRVYEAGRVGEHMRRWGHVRLFSPWRLNHSRLGARLLRAAGHTLPDDEDLLTGAEHVEAYLEPLARSAPLRERIEPATAVRQIGRERIGKAQPLGGPRERHPFRLLLDAPAGERIDAADLVIDASGTYGQPNWMGDGNIPALGERRLRQRIAYTLQDILGSERGRYEGRRVLVVGAGQSAATALDALLRLDGTEVIWVVRRDTDRPYRPIPDDPLRERDRQSRLGNSLAAGADDRVRYYRGTVVERVDERGPRFAVTLRSAAAARERVEVDRILAHVGYAPDNSLYRELQIHECYATAGPMRLAAALLEDGSADCLAQTARGAETLTSPEPGFFLVGAKSYGRNSQFLIRLGLEQVREVFTLIERRPELNLYAA